MSLLVTGSIAIDSIETPTGVADDVLGGSAVYFSLAAALYSPVRLVGVVGDDFDMNLLAPLEGKPIDRRGLEVRSGSKTFRWRGKYVGAMNEAETLDVKLNVLAEYGPPIPPEFADSRYVFLANTHPALQRGFVEQLPAAELIVCDTMNLWIENELQELSKTLGVVHSLALNEGEARMLTGQANLVLAGRDIIKMGPRFVVIKKGEHGSLLVNGEQLACVPAYPTTQVRDPTGAGDSFAGAMMGYIASRGVCDDETLRRGMARGSVVSSFVIESFSTDALAVTTPADVDRRLAELRSITRFD